MRIKIIYPSRIGKDGNPVKTRARYGRLLNLSFCYLAGLTPPTHEVEIADDLFEDIDFDRPVDLVALTAMTMQAPRAYQLAAEYRRRGVKVVMGGFHASFMPQEVAKHVDAVVIGEAEVIWPELIEDAEKGRLKKIYGPARPQSLAGLPAPRYDLVANKRQRYLNYPLWVGRGCPHNCKFCSVTSLYGRTIRTRPVDEIIRDAGMIPIKRVFIVDDNLFAYGKFLYTLLPQLGRLKFKWGGQLDPRLAENEDLLDLAKESGMELAYIGFENFLPERLQRMGKDWVQIERYGQIIEKIHRRGIAVQASMIFGMSQETPETVKQTLKRLEEWRVESIALALLSPAPGTEIRDELLQRGAEISENWSIYDGNHVVFAPDGMTAEELDRLYWYLYQSFFSFRSIARRFFRKPYKLINWLRYLARNILVYRKDVLSRHQTFENYFSLSEVIPSLSGPR